MPIKIKPCHSCWASYSLEDFRALPLVNIDPNDSAETRTCRRCGGAMTVDVAFVATLDLRDKREVYEDAIAPYAAMRARRRALWLALGLALALCLVAFALWSR